MKQKIIDNNEESNKGKISPESSEDPFHQENSSIEFNSTIQEYNVEEDKDFLRILKIFCILLISPLEGWKTIRRHNISSNIWAQNCFYPIIAFSAVSIFFNKFYNPYASIEELLIPAVARFIAFFFGYFLISILCQIFLPNSSQILTESNFGKIFIMSILASLAVFIAVISFLPMLEPVFVFLPLWSIYILYKGVRFLKLSEHSQAWTVIVLGILIVGIPYLLNWSFNIIL